ncbi:MAG TPA: PKD domain-containing protein, partial [Membranihabitans sp.]|nr:PKD domain-containing protein [Membranihabitans sp.]
TSVITNLAPGEYTVTVTDDNGCETSASYLITEPSEPEVVGFTYDDDNLTVQFTNTSTSGSYLWDFGDGNTSADINPIHVYAGPGMHEVCLTLFSDCGDIENCQEINLVTTGINRKAFTDFVVFPNPASDQFNFEIADQEIYTLTFYDVRSRLQFATTLSGQRAIDISEWASGIYFFVLRNENGAPVKNGKVIVQD